MVRNRQDRGPKKVMADRAYLIFACMSGPSFNAHVLLRWGMPACPCMQNPELRLAERRIVPCGERTSTLRQVLEYFPQSTLRGAAREEGVVRPRRHPFLQGRARLSALRFRRSVAGMPCRGTAGMEKEAAHARGCGACAARILMAGVQRLLSAAAESPWRR